MKDVNDDFQGYLDSLALTLPDNAIARNASITACIGYLVSQANDPDLPVWVRATLARTAAEIEDVRWDTGERRGEYDGGAQ